MNCQEQKIADVSLGGFCCVSLAESSRDIFYFCPVDLYIFLGNCRVNFREHHYKASFQHTFLTGVKLPKLS